MSYHRQSFCFVKKADEGEENSNSDHDEGNKVEGCAFVILALFRTSFSAAIRHLNILLGMLPDPFVAQSFSLCNGLYSTLSREFDDILFLFEKIDVLGNRNPRKEVED